MGRQYGDHTELRKQIVAQREEQAKKKVKQIKYINIAALAAFTLIGCISVGSNALRAKSLKEKAASVTQECDDKKAQLDHMVEVKEMHDGLIDQHVKDNFIDVDYDSAVELFKDDFFVENIVAIENNSLSELCQTICDLQNSMNDYVYQGYRKDDDTVSKEQGDRIIQMKSYIADSSFNIWSSDMIEDYYDAYSDKDKDFFGLPAQMPFKWIGSCDYTYSVVTRTMDMAWKCVSVSDENVVYAIVSGTYDSDSDKFTGLEIFVTDTWENLLDAPEAETDESPVIDIEDSEGE